MKRVDRKRWWGTGSGRIKTESEVPEMGMLLGERKYCLNFKVVY